MSLSHSLGDWRKIQGLRLSPPASVLPGHIVDITPPQETNSRVFRVSINSTNTRFWRLDILFDSCRLSHVILPNSSAACDGCNAMLHDISTQEGYQKTKEKLRCGILAVQFLEAT